MPRVFKRGSISTFTRVTLNPTLFAVFAGILSPEKKKSSAVTASGFLQNFPFTNTTQRKFFHCQKNKIKIKIKIKQKTKKKHFYNNGQVKLKKKKTDVDDDTTIRHVFIKFFFFFN